MHFYSGLKIAGAFIGTIFFISLGLNVYFVTHHTEEPMTNSDSHNGKCFEEF